MRWQGSLLFLGALALSPAARAHGIWGHVHVTGWAVENMPDDELRAFLLEPEVFNALLFGAAFTDSGYSSDEAASRAYSEHTHWEPFITDFVEWIRVNDPPPWDTLESKKRVAFLMGCASHGLQDEIFDSLFLFRAEEEDAVGQEGTDPGIDGFLVLDGHIRFVPEQDIPMDTLLELYAGVDPGITEELILDQVELMTSFYVNGDIGLDIAAGLGQQYEPDLPWTRSHYLDPDIPGSLRAEIIPTRNYQQALWARLHDDFPAEETNTFVFPEVPRRLATGEPGTIASAVTFGFGAGVQYVEGLTELVDASGAPVAMTQTNSRWGPQETRLLKLEPEVALAPGGWYTARVGPALERIDGPVTGAPFELTFQVACDDATADLCPDLGDLPIASIDGLPADDADGDAPAAVGLAEQGCGCATGPSGAPWPLLPLLLLLSRRSGVAAGARDRAARG